MTTSNSDKATKMSPADKQKMVDGHKKTATHLEAASKHHTEAAKNHEADDHEKAGQSMGKAKEHLDKAVESHKEVEKMHSSKK